jgi:hypothetical protein
VQSQRLLIAFFPLLSVLTAVSVQVWHRSSSVAMRELPRHEAAKAIGGTTCEKYKKQSCHAPGWDICESGSNFIAIDTGNYNLTPQADKAGWCTQLGGTQIHCLASQFDPPICSSPP